MSQYWISVTKEVALRLGPDPGGHSGRFWRGHSGRFWRGHSGRFSRGHSGWFPGVARAGWRATCRWRAAWAWLAAVTGDGVGVAGGGPVAGGVLGLGGDRVRPRRQDRARYGGALEPGPHARFAALVDGG